MRSAALGCRWISVSCPKVLPADFIFTLKITPSPRQGQEWLQQPSSECQSRIHRSGLRQYSVTDKAQAFICRTMTVMIKMLNSLSEIDGSGLAECILPESSPRLPPD